MKLSKCQQGASMWETCLYVSMFLFVVTIALKLGPLYMDDMNISSAIDGLHAGLAGKDASEVTNTEIKNTLDKSFQISMIPSDTLKYIEVERADNQVLLKLNYDARNNFMGNVDVVVRFQHEVNLSEPFKK